MTEPPAAAGRLAGEVALVTGSTTGIGAAVAARFAAEGASVVVTGRHEGRGRRVVEQIRAAGGTAELHLDDLASEGACADLVDHVVETFGGLTVLVNNAAADTPDAAVHDLATDDWDRVLRIDLSAAMWLSRAAIGAMLDAEHGSIVNLALRAAGAGAPGRAAATVADGALEALTRSVALDYAADGIRCNALRIDQASGTATTTGGGLGDVATAALFLASEEARAITGAVLPVRLVPVPDTPTLG